MKRPALYSHMLFSRLKMLETHSAHSERCIVVDFRLSPTCIVGDADSHFPASSPHGARPHGSACLSKIRLWLLFFVAFPSKFSKCSLHVVACFQGTQTCTFLAHLASFRAQLHLWCPFRCFVFTLVLHECFFHKSDFFFRWGAKKLLP